MCGLGHCLSVYTYDINYFVGQKRSVSLVLSDAGLYGRWVQTCVWYQMYMYGMWWYRIGGTWVRSSSQARSALYAHNNPWIDNLQGVAGGRIVYSILREVLLG